MPVYSMQSFLGRFLCFLHYIQLMQLPINPVHAGFNTQQGPFRPFLKFIVPYYRGRQSLCLLPSDWRTLDGTRVYRPKSDGLTEGNVFSFGFASKATVTHTFKALSRQRWRLNPLKEIYHWLQRRRKKKFCWFNDWKSHEVDILLLKTSSRYLSPTHYFYFWFILMIIHHYIQLVKM